MWKLAETGKGISSLEQKRKDAYPIGKGDQELEKRLDQKELT
jgi:hypothetical protein